MSAARRSRQATTGEPESEVRTICHCVQHGSGLLQPHPANVKYRYDNDTNRVGHSSTGMQDSSCRVWSTAGLSQGGVVLHDRPDMALHCSEPQTVDVPGSKHRQSPGGLMAS